MRHKRTYLPAAQFVEKMVRRYGINRPWVWDVLEDEFNIIKGIGCVMDREDMERAEDALIAYIVEDLIKPTN